MLESLFIKIARVQACSFIKKRLECFPVNTEIFKDSYFEDICKWLLLCFWSWLMVEI